MLLEAVDLDEVTGREEMQGAGTRAAGGLPATRPVRGNAC